MNSNQPRSRRIFLADLGKAAVGLIIMSACSDSTPTSTTVTPQGTVSTSSTTSTSAPATTQSSSTTSEAAEPPTTTVPSAAGPQWGRVAVGSVSAYVVVRDGEATIVDTGNPGSETAIGNTLAELGSRYEDVAHLILTHRHPDHIGSVDGVMTAAAGASAYAGAGDLGSITAPREVVPVGDNDSVAGLEIIETPGHTPGHISVLDPELSLLIAGDAMIGRSGGVAGPVPDFTDDMLLATASVVRLAEFQFDTVVFGHGEPVIGGASDQVRELAAEL